MILVIFLHTLINIVFMIVTGQESLIFDGGNVPQASSTPISGMTSSSYHIDENTQNSCVCVSIGSCTGVTVNPGSSSVDLRIVNQAVTTTTCPVGFVSCCTSGAQSPSASSSSTCGMREISKTTIKIPGQADYGAYPWQAAILNPSNNQYLGAGVLITESHVLTVAHKVVNLRNNFKVRLGEWNSASNTEQIVEALPAFVTIHQNYVTSNLNNDIAVIKLNMVIPISNYPNINTACLPTMIPTANTRCWTCGWGVNAFKGGQYQNILKEVDLQILDQNSCESLFRATRLGPNFQFSQTSFLCAGGIAGKDTCTGDGGGGLMCEQTPGQFHVTGLTSWGVGCGQVNVPAAYVNVYHYLSWINQQISR